MLTPAFSISQDDEFVTVLLKCPYIKAQDVEFYIQDTEFKFYVRPYFLRLTFPASIIEDGREKASYDVDKGEITVKLPKAIKGEAFADLDFLTKLMAPKGGPAPGTAAASSESFGSVSSNMQSAQPPNPRSGPLIEVIGDGPPNGVDTMEGVDGGDGEDDDEDDGQNYHWDYPQESLPQPELQTSARYGFNNAHSGYGAHIQEIAYEVLDVTDLETSTPQSRREQRIVREDLKFDQDHYMADYLNREEEIQPMIDYKPDFWKALKRIQKARAVGAGNTTKLAEEQQTQPILIQSLSPPFSASAPSLDMPNVGGMNLNSHASSSSDPSATASDPSLTEPRLTFTEAEQEQMRSLPNKEYLLNDPQSTYLGLVDLLFAYAYNHRTTSGESTVESPWTLTKLSATLSSFDTFHTLTETLVASIRRCLAYPLYRSFPLAMRCVEDTAVLFKLGKRAILKVLLEMRQLVGGDDRMYVLSRVWLDDYSVWIQRASDKQLQSLASELNHVKITKSQIGWDLDQVEEAARRIPIDEGGEDDDNVDVEAAGGDEEEPTSRPLML
ncbi:SHQ1 protein-domain-containing protein [Powellomyces hirtus]|nr:SHQ1 protein-domain-containing protein [Powellomyces hirtus]